MKSLPDVRKPCVSCGAIGRVNVWWDAGEILSAFICDEHHGLKKEEEARKKSMQHIIATARDTKTLCGLDRDKATMSGSGMCPNCALIDRSIQAAIGFIRDPRYQSKTIAFFEKISGEFHAESQVLTQATVRGATKVDYKSSAVKALKRAAAAGSMKIASKKIKAKLTEKFPQLELLPQNIWDVLLCLAINMVASSSPDLPGIKFAESLSSEAFEGLLTDVTSEMVQDVMEVVSETFLELTEKKPGLLSERE